MFLGKLADFVFKIFEYLLKNPVLNNLKIEEVNL